MSVIGFYFLKVILCSGVLFSYYHLVLRNNVFHQWNRFYLLGSVLLSILLPWLQFRFTPEASHSLHAWQVLAMLQKADHQLQELVVVSSSPANLEQLIPFAFSLVCLFFLARYVYSLVRIHRIIRSHAVQKVDDIFFVNTSLAGTPFTFLRYIFWNNAIPLQTPTGQQIFQHERVHVTEKHTLDKLFLQLVIVFFWWNPFFWLLRKELYFIHEFIADRKAVESKDTKDFAAMILQVAYPHQFSTITNSFFQKSIKRRINMLTKIQNPKLAYIGRLLALPLVATTVLAFAVRTEPEELRFEESKNSSLLLHLQEPQKPSLDTIPKKKEISSVDVQKSSDRKMSEITISYKDGTKEKVTGEEAIKRGLTITNRDEDLQKQEFAKSQSQPLFLLNGKEISREELDKIDPKKIKSVNVLKDQSATSKYGEKGKNGVVEISTADDRNETVTLLENNQQVGTGNINNNVSNSNGSAVSVTIDDNKVFTKTETPASVSVGEWRSFLVTHLQPILEKAKKNGAKPGVYTVNVRFLVNKDGTVSNFEALNNPGYDFDKQILAIMPNTPKWNPALQNGRVVNAYHTQPITLIIQ